MHRPEKPNNIGGLNKTRSDISSSKLIKTKVTTGQVIGEAFTNKKTGETLLGFRVYKNDATQNPEYWLSKS